MNVSEPDVDYLMRNLQRLVERSPVHLRPKRRQIMRGMRAALFAMADAPTLEGLSRELAYELLGVVPEEPVTVRHATPDPIPERAEQIIALLEKGMSFNTVCKLMHCSRSTVHRCKQLREERAQQCAALAQ
ncbi:helix-turn-helix domain-containing protein [Pseudomonas sp. NPDC089401]|uniref:helix-turn-helix domain-containing protein n=1 Tax=Pseudomonas sp. NPDC089401 TaxID=3364462 RepID=UPI00381B3C51